jgi:DNA-binding LacI/PurR family transcriptional regulator
MAVKLKEIAALAGVSQPVVSAVLNNTGGGVRVSEEKSRKIRDIADKLGYVPNYAAQKLRGRQTPTIGIIGGGFQSPMQTVLVSQLMRKFYEKGYFVLLSSDIDDDSTTDGHAAMRELLSRGLDGVILIGSYNQAMQKLLNLPCVIIRNHAPEQRFDYNIDAETGTFLAVKHLFEHGHKKIIVVDKSGQKYSGAQKAFEEAGISMDCLKPFGMTDEKDNKNKQKELLRLIRDENFTALVSSNDFMAGRIMNFLHFNGVRVPEDFALIGYNGSAFTKFTSPPLTTVVQPLKLMAEKAFELLLHRMTKGINGIEHCKSEMIVPHLAYGGSCGCKAQAINELINRPETLTLE